MWQLLHFYTVKPSLVHWSSPLIQLRKKNRRIIENRWGISYPEWSPKNLTIYTYILYIYTQVKHTHTKVERKQEQDRRMAKWTAITRKITNRGSCCSLQFVARETENNIAGRCRRAGTDRFPVTDSQQRQGIDDNRIWWALLSGRFKMQFHT